MILMNGTGDDPIRFIMPAMQTAAVSNISEVLAALFKGSQQCNAIKVDYDLGANGEEQLEPISRMLPKNWTIHMKSARLPIINKEITNQWQTHSNPL